MSLKIKDHLIGSKSPCFIIAEASSNHGRDFQRAKKMVEAAALARADAVKFQVFSADKIAANTEDPRAVVKVTEKAVFVKKDTKLFDLYLANELPRSWLPKLSKYAKELGILFLATPFDVEAVDQLEEIGVPAYKVASYELLDVPLLRKIAITKKPVILSTGMARLGEIEFALNVLQAKQVALLHCNSLYPATLENVNLCAMDTLRLAFPDFPIGFSDHTLGMAIPLAAVARGAQIIEKHFYLDDGVSSIDDQFSLNPQQLKEMVIAIRNIEKALGSSEKKPSFLEEKEKVQGRRSLWIVKDIHQGERFCPQNIKCLRPGLGISPEYYDLIMGKQAPHFLSAVNPLEWKDVF